MEFHWTPLSAHSYLAAIDVIAKENLMFGLSQTEKNNSMVEFNHSTRLLKIAQKSGKAIFVIEYLKNSANIEMVKERMPELGFVVYIGQRGLASLAGDGGVDEGATAPTSSVRPRTQRR
jgi:endo-alpha-1,4-polygalactosaminidase (GH114 family)